MRLDFHRNPRLLFGTVLFGFIGLSFIIAVLPALRIQNRNEPLPSSEPLTTEQKRGLAVYVEEGCVSCHTQQVRPVKVDQDLGRPSVPGDFARLGPENAFEQTPGVLGSKRTGPDLTNIGKRQPSKTWHLLHLYQPRAVVEESIMPAFPWLFKITEDPVDSAPVVQVPEPYGPEKGEVVATERAENLVAYLQSLKQAPLPERYQSGESDKKQGEPEGKSKSDSTKNRGATVYANKCAQCHQSNGKGVPGTFPPLAGDPVVTANNPRKHLQIIVNGLQGKPIDGTDYAAAMPAFGDRLDVKQLTAVINHERQSWGNDAPTVTVEKIRKLLDKISNK